MPSSSFELLDPRIQRWIWQEGWTELRAVQEMAIDAIMHHDDDVILAAATATGKTEAAFLPILSRMLENGECKTLTLYISPLKALINDQFSRLEHLCQDLDIPVHPWHGDITAAVKAKFRRQPYGVLLITPESLEAMFCLRGSELSRLFSDLRFVAIDELHAFIGTERGKQLQSLLQRLQHVDGVIVPRIALSATLGDMQLAAEYLRSDRSSTVRIIEAPSDGGVLKILIKGYLDESTQGIGGESDVISLMAQDIYRATRGSNNLVFPNTRAAVELLAYRLRKLCTDDGLPNEYWPHHGSLSKELREEVERALKKGTRPATAICTSTLELGVDIGSVKSVIQVNRPHSVSSLRQRMGRSGRRRGEPTILRGAVVESMLTVDSHLLDQLREDTVQFVAVVLLMREHWFEPPKAHGLHLSTLVQQLLSLIAQKSGVNPAAAYKFLCSHGAFRQVEHDDFVELLKYLKTIRVIEQEDSGLILIGKTAEPIVNNFRFYAAFAAPEEYRLIEATRVLGSLPVSSALAEGDLIIFAGRTWRVHSIDEPSKTITVTAHRASRPPTFPAIGIDVHGRVRSKMREVYESTERFSFLDATAATFIEEGRRAYHMHGLDKRCIVGSANDAVLFPWLGDDSHNVLEWIFKSAGFECKNMGLGIQLSGKGLSEQVIASVLMRFAERVMPNPNELLADAELMQEEKWDWALPRNLLIKSYASKRLDIPSAHVWAGKATGLLSWKESRPTDGHGALLADTIMNEEPAQGENR